MRSIADTIARLAPQVAVSPRDRLHDLSETFDNPGNLRARAYIPESLRPGAPLVVVLHGCTQTAAGYDYGAGWSEVADAHGFALLFPEQRRANNPNVCFSWFLDADTTRGEGEVASIRAMIAGVVAEHRIDPQRIFVTGLSAGGAMTAAMLAAYPEVFAGGAIVAGLPHRVAHSVPEALERMRGQGLPPAKALARLVTDASPHRGPWPTVSVWHGSGDMTVVPAAGEAVVTQWLGVHGLPATATAEELVDGHSHRIWRDRSGRVLVEAHGIAGMGHGTPLDTRACGSSGPFMLDVGISSTLRIAESWGIAPPQARRRPSERRPAGLAAGLPHVPASVERVIDDALRAAGLR